MSTWDERRQTSFSYKLCLCMLLLPLIFPPVFFLLSIPWLGIDVIFMGLISSVLLLAVALGCGARYRYRSINPSSRIIMNYGDGHYFERIGADESDYS